MKALHEIALVGTAHLSDEARGALASGMPTDDLVSALPEDVSLERRVLLAAALQATVAAAGVLPLQGVEPFAAAPADPRPACNAKVAALLQELTGAAPALLAEGLARLVSAGQVVPPALVPELVATRHAGLARVVAEAIGERGRWFCAVSGKGEWLGGAAAEADAGTAWQEGKHAERLAALAARRRTAPAEARRWIAETWTHENAEHRAELLQVLADGLAPEDTELLEGVLADRSANVRATAAGLLSRVAASPTAQRLVERVDAMLSYEAAAPGGLLSRVRSALGGAGRGVLAVAVPSAFDPEWEKEGIPAKPPKGLGEKAHWLSENLALVAPGHWEARFGAAPAELVGAAAQTEWATAVFAGWSRAALRTGGSAWIAALWDGWRELKIDPALGLELNTRARLMNELLARMDREDVERRVLALATTDDANVPLGPVTLVEAVPAPWSASFSAALLRAIQPRLEAVIAQGWTPGTWLDALVPVAARLDPATFTSALAVEAALVTRELTPALQKRLEEFRQVLHLRHRIHEEIRP